MIWSKHFVDGTVIVEARSFHFGTSPTPALWLALATRITTTMKTLWVLPLLSLSSVFASPEQVVLSDNFLIDKAALKSVANQFLSDAKKAILEGKKNLETWFHDGKEFVKQNELLCTCSIAYCGA